MPITGGDLVSKNIIAFGGQFLAQVNKDMELARKILDLKIEKNISLSDHSLADLRGMGHPYARRAPQAIHDPGYQVHEQTGEMRRAKYSGVDKAKVSSRQLEARAYVGIDEKVTHAFYVVYGTSKMIPRDFLVGSLGEVRNQVWDILKRSLGNAVVSFNGQTRRL